MMMDDDGAAGAAAAIDDGAGAGAGGGAGDAGAGAAGAAGASGGAAGAAGAGAAAGAAAEADPDWLEHFSAEGGDADNPSNRDWVKALGVKDLDALAKIARDNQKAARGKGIQIPGDDAKPEELAAFNKAIGVPDKAEDYAITLPEGVKEDELDMDLLNGLRAKALEAGTPAKAFDKLVQGVIQGQMDAIAAEKTSEDADRDALYKEWGPQKDAKVAEVNNAVRVLGLKRADVVAMQRGFRMQYGEPGSRRTLELLQKLGAGLAEDKLLGGDGPRRFGVTGEEAQAEINKLQKDPEFGKKLLAKDPDAIARWDRLNAAVAADKDRKQRAAAAG